MNELSNSELFSQLKHRIYECQSLMHVSAKADFYLNRQLNVLLDAYALYDIDELGPVLPALFQILGNSRKTLDLIRSRHPEIKRFQLHQINVGNETLQ